MKLRQSHRQSPIALAIASICLLGIESCNHAGYGQREASSLDCAKTTHVKSSAESSSTDAGPPPCGLPVELWHPEWPKSLTATLDRELEPAPPDAITFVLLPDTQYYAHCRYPHLRNQGNWIAEQRAQRQILTAITLGDLTDRNTPEEWAFFRDALAPITQGFPLLLTTGNHDLGNDGTTDSRESLLSNYFDEKWAQSNGALRAVMTPGHIENAFYSLNAGRYRLGVLMLEWSPRRITVEWENQVLTRFKDHRVIVATHAYTYDDSTRYDRATRPDQQWSPLDYHTAEGAFAEDGNHDGEQLWNDLVRRHPGIFMVVSGHVLGQGTGRLTSRGNAGNAVHQVLVNYQMLDQGGLGYLRFFEIHPDGRTVHMKTYSPSLRLYSYAADQDFRLEIDPPLRHTD